MPINPDEAPRGYVAKLTRAGSGCAGCAFHAYALGSCRNRPCTARGRADGCDVIFITKPAPKPWTYRTDRIGD